jgi:hypothetical protein
VQNINRYSLNIPSQILTQYRACMPGERAPDVTIGNGAGLTFASMPVGLLAILTLNVVRIKLGIRLRVEGVFVGELHHVSMAPDSRAL